MGALRLGLAAISLSVAHWGVGGKGRRACEDSFFAGAASGSDRDGGVRSEGCLTLRGHDMVGKGGQCEASRVKSKKFMCLTW